MKEIQKKARQLVKKFYQHSLYVPLDNAKKCAVICAEEVISSSKHNNVEVYNTDWWNKVIIEIRKVEEL